MTAVNFHWRDGIPRLQSHYESQDEEDYTPERDESLFPRLFKMAKDIRMMRAPESRDESMDGHEALELIGILFQNIEKKPVELFSRAALGAPWKVPRTLPQASLINRLLAHSMSVQRSAFLFTEFENCIMSGDCMTVCGLMHFYLENYLGIKSDVNLGILKLNDDVTGGGGGRGRPRGLPMVWLTIHGTLIDNTFHHFPDERRRPPGSEVFDDKLVAAKRVENYSEEDPTSDDLGLELVEELGSNSCPHDLRLYKAFGNQRNIEKYTVFRAMFAPVYPHMRMYSMGMAPLLAELKTLSDYDKPTFNLWMKWSQQCWNCHEKDGGFKLKLCAVCKKGRYCSTECQREDWASHKLLHRDMEANISYWEEKSANVDVGPPIDLLSMMMPPPMLHQPRRQGRRNRR